MYAVHEVVIASVCVEALAAPRMAPTLSLVAEMEQLDRFGNTAQAADLMSSRDDYRQCVDDSA
jgi:hypothetical protein